MLQTEATDRLADELFHTVFPPVDRLANQVGGGRHRQFDGQQLQFFQGLFPS